MSNINVVGGGSIDLLLRRRAMMMRKKGLYQVAWNQLVGQPTMRKTSYAGVTIGMDKDYTGWNISGVSESTRNTAEILTIPDRSGHIFYVSHSASDMEISSSTGGILNEIFAITQDVVSYRLRQIVDETYDYFLQMWAYDLTQMFGEGNEPADTAEFEDWLSENDLNGYKPYNEGETIWTTKPQWIDPEKPSWGHIWYYADEKITLNDETNVISHTFSNGKGDIRAYNATAYAYFRYTPVMRVVMAQSFKNFNSGYFCNSCPNLREVVMSDNIRTIPTGSFSNASNLQYCHMPKYLQTLMINSFYQCSNLLSADLPETITTIGTRAFTGCNKLPYIIIRAVVPPTVTDSSFPNNACPLYVPAESVDAYKEAWTDYASRIQAIPDNLL